jgi:hypothetical protein
MTIPPERLKAFHLCQERQKVQADDVSAAAK